MTRPALTRPALTRPALTRLAATGALLLAAVACSSDGGSSAPDAPAAPTPSSSADGGVSAVPEEQRTDLLQRLGQVDPALDSGRSVGRARNVCVGVERGLSEDELVTTVQDRFTDVPLDDEQAAQVLTAVRETLCP